MAYTKENEVAQYRLFEQTRIGWKNAMDTGLVMSIIGVANLVWLIDDCENGTFDFERSRMGETLRNGQWTG